MRVSELKAILNAVEEEHGDVQILPNDGAFCYDDFVGPGGVVDVAMRIKDGRYVEGSALHPLGVITLRPDQVMTKALVL